MFEFCFPCPFWPKALYFSNVENAYVIRERDLCLVFMIYKPLEQDVFLFMMKLRVDEKNNICKSESEKIKIL